ncbi:condensation domain-containing protein, partial [Streptomyces sp. CB01881]|uniref:condensation domain-containing protein n=1 Tax=Streptomyces sp. CB01881 TaxID=2078691 RepID=UPI001F4F3099
MPLPVIDLGALPADHQLTTARHLAEQEAQQPFDLQHGPLLRTTLLRLTPTQHVLLLTFHHIVTDGWSLGVFMRELGELYIAATQNRTPTLTPLPIQYPDFALWQRTRLTGENLDTEITHWRNELADAPTLLELPTDHPRPAIQTYRGANHTTHWPTTLLHRVQQLSRNEGTTVFQTLLTAYTTLLTRYTNQNDIVVGTPIANRTHPELENLIGFFANTLALRTRTHDNPTFRELLHRVRETTLRAYAHQDLPFERLVEALEPERTLSHNPLVQTLFVLQHTPTTNTTTTWPDLRVSPLNNQSQGTTAKFDITLTAYEAPDGLTLNAEYNTDLFNPPTIQRLLTHLHTLLENALDNPDQPIHTLP